MSRQRATLAWLRDLRRVPCLDCGGVFEPYVMDFDHRDPATKGFNLGGSRAMLKSREELLQEITKCDIVCVNCHRARTHAAFMSGAIRPLAFTRRAEGGTREQRRSREKWHRLRRTQADLLRSMRETPCLDCDRTFPWFVMEFDHRDPARKLAAVTRLVGQASMQRLLEEIAKCDIVCANCHRVRSHMQRSARGSRTVEVRLPSKQVTRVRFPSPAQTGNSDS